MGQYFKAINIDKKEQIKPHDFDNGAKLMEFSYEGNNYISSLYKLLETRWKGDRVYITGDYDDEIFLDETSCYYDTYKKICDELKTKSLYEHSEKWKKLSKKEIGPVSNKLYKRIYNIKTREFINLNKLPVEWIYRGGVDAKTGKRYEAGCVSISPLPLLLTFGNGAGGSFYCQDDNRMNLLGSWCGYAEGIIVSKKILKEYEENFEEFIPDFTENKNILTYEDGIEKLEIIKKSDDYIEEFRNAKDQTVEKEIINKINNDNSIKELKNNFEDTIKSIAKIIQDKYKINIEDVVQSSEELDEIDIIINKKVFDYIEGIKNNKKILNCKDEDEEII